MSIQAPRFERGPRAAVERRKRLRSASAILWPLIFSLLAGWAPAQTADSYVFRQIESALRQRGVQLQARSFDYSITGLSVDLRGVTARALDSGDLPPFFSADRIQASVTLRTLTGGTPRITSARLERPVIRVVTDPSGTSNLPSGDADSPPGAPQESLPAFLIDVLTASDGELIFEDKGSDLRLQTRGWNVRVRGDAAQLSHAVSIGGLTGSASLGVKELPIHSLAATLRLTRRDLLVEALSAAVGHNRLEASGKIEDLFSPRLDLRVDSELSPGELLWMADQYSQIGGRLNVRSRLLGPLDGLRLESQIDGYAAGPELKPVSLNARLAAGLADSSLRLDSLSIRSAYGNLTARGELAGNRDSTSRLTLAFEQVDLSEAARLAQVETRPAATLTAQLETSWPGLEFSLARLEGTFKAVPKRVAAARDRLPVAMAGTFSGGPGDLKVNLSSAAALGVRMRGPIRLDSFASLDRLAEARLRATLQGSIADAGDTLAQVGRFLGSLPEGTPSPEELGGTVDFSLSLSGPATAPEATLTALSNNFRLRQFEDARIDLEALATSRSVEFRRLDLAWNQATVNASGRLPLAGPESPVEASLRLRNLPLPVLLTAAGRDLPLDGLLEMDLVLSGSLERPRAEFSLSASRLAGYGQVPSELKLNGRFDGAAIEVDKAVLTQELPGEPAGRASLTGRWDTATGRFEIRAAGEGLRLAPDAALGNLSGVFDLQASGQGTFQDPSLQAQLIGRGLLLDGNPAGTVTAVLNMRDGEAQMTVEAPAFAARAQSQVSLLAPHPYRLDARFERLDLAALPFQTPEGFRLDGLLSGSVAAEGTLDQWRESTAELNIPELSLRLNGRQVELDAPLRAGFRDRVLRIDSAAFRSGASRLALQGRLPLDPQSDGRIETRGTFELSDLENLAPDLGILYLDGTAQLEGGIAGNLQRLDPDLTLSLGSATLAHEGLNSPIEAAGFELALSAGAVRLRRLQARLDSAEVSADAEIPLSLLGSDLPMPAAEGPARFRLQLTGFSPASLAAAPEGLTGNLAATVEGSADKLAFEAVTARAEFQNLDVTLQGYRLGQTTPTRLSLHDQIASVENFILAGPSLNLRVSGDTLLFNPRMYDLRIDGDLDASVVSRFFDNLNATGVTRLQASLAGPLDAPELNGFLEATDIDLRLRSPRLLAEQLNLRLDFRGDRVEIGRLSGQINGGPVSGSGGFRWSGAQPSDVALDLDAKEVFLNFPAGLRTLSDVSLQVRSRDEGIVLGGQINVTDGSFTENIDLESRLFELIRSGGPEVPAEPNPLLEQLRFNVALNTVNPLLISNNLARLEMNIDLTARGNFYRPGLTGNINLAEGGELYLREKTYLIDRGTILLLDQTRIAPTLNVLARTQAGRYDITLKISGPPDDLSTDFTSDPPLPEPDIIAVLITGRTLDELRGAEANVAKEQTLSYLTGTFGSRLGAEAEKALGLSKVRIEPNLIAPESSPGARLTIGEDLTRDLRLIYSTNLVDSGDQIYIAEYDITRRFVTRGIKQADNTYRFEFNHDLRFGGGRTRSDSSSTAPRKIGEIRFQGETFFSPEELRKKLKLKEGQEFDFFKVRKGVDRLDDWYRKNDLLESRVRLTREAQNGFSDLNFAIRPGPKVRFEYAGDPISDSLRRKVREIWAEGVFDAQRIDDAALAIREDWIRKGRLTPTVESTIEQISDDQKLVRFQIEAGPRFDKVTVEFPGASGVPPDTLREQIAQADLSAELLSRPAEAVEFLTALYRREGYLSPRVEPPVLRVGDDGKATIVIAVEEGVVAQVGSIRLEGNRVIDDQTLLDAIPLREGATYRPAMRENSRQALQDLYWAKGYNDVLIEDTVRAPKPGDPFEVSYRIREGRLAVVREIRAQGFNRTNEGFILRQLEIAAGDPLIFEKLSRSRKRLYDTGAYSLVEIDSEPIQDAGDDEIKPVRLQVRVRELTPFELRYGGFYDTDRGLGVTADFRNRNSLGSARVLGLRTRYDGDVRELRGYFSQPALKNLPLKTTVDGFLRREIRPDFITDRQGVSLQQEAQLRDRFIFSYGYRIERNDTFERDPDPIFGFDIPPFIVAALTSTLTRDSRDDILDATRGTFTSLGLEYAEDFIGSDLRFIRFFGQHYRYYPLSKAEEIPWSGGEKQPRWVFASGVRVGLARGLGGQILVPSERFFAGGGTTIRGFEQDAIGQDTDLFGGGDALFIFNNELRFPIFNIFDGVAFVDVGNVYSNISDFDPFDIRSAAGLGLRVRTPYFLLRLDYGFKLDRQAGESQGEFFFSIGQAF